MANNIISHLDKNDDSEFSIELAEKFLNSDERFPVDLDDAWVWLGYAKKGNAKAVLIENFIEGVDYVIAETAGNAFPRASQKIFLTIDCFKTFGMIAQTEQGKLIRRYFLECEKQLKVLTETREFIEPDKNARLASNISTLINALAHSRSKGIEDAIAIKLMAGDRQISRETAEWLMETDVKGDRKTASDVQPDSDLTSALARQPGTRRGRKREDRILSKHFGVYRNYQKSCWMAKIPLSDGSFIHLGSRYRTETEAYKAVEQGLIDHNVQ